MKDKKSVFSASLFIIVFFLVSTIFLGSKPASAAKIKIIKGITQGTVDNEYNTTTVVPFIEAVNKRLEGNVRIDFIGGPEVIGVNEQADAVRSGAIDMQLYQARGLPATLVPGVMASDLTQLNGMEERESGAFDVLSEAYEKYLNAKYLGQPHSGPGTQFHIFLKDPISKIDELKGKHLRVYGVFEAISKALRASSVNLPFTELYTAMQRGVIDGYISLNHSLIMASLADVANYVVYPGFMQMTSSMYMNLDVWNSLSKNEQDVIMEEVIKMEVRGIELSKDSDVADLEKAKAINTKVITLNPDESAKLLEIVDSASWAYVLKSDVDGYAARLKPLITK